MTLVHETATPSSNVSRKKVLVIDDDDGYRTFIGITLKLLGYDIVEAADGMEGLEAIKLHHPDLVLCDVNMPKMDGDTVLKTLKADPQYGSIPFIFLTGNATNSDMRHGMQLGADDYLTKPFTAEDLIAAVETRLRSKKSLQKYYESQFDDIKTSIVRSLPHEFRTPLNGILGCAQILREESGLPAEEVKELATLIHRSGERLHHLLENMILFGELQFLMNDKGRIATMRRESATTLCEVIRSVAERESTILGRDGSIEIAVADGPVQISSIHLTKIMEEVVGNALKYSKSGTRVSISGDITSAEARVTIRDEGRGMTAEQIGKVAAFQQFDRRYHEQQGAGLGLAIAKNLAELYGGSLTIESKESIGTTVTLCLPRA